MLAATGVAGKSQNLVLCPVGTAANSEITNVNQDFKGTTSIRAAYLLIVFVMPALSLAVRNESDAFYLHTMTAVALVTVFVAWPRAIHFDTAGIWQRDRVGRIHRIPWSSVDSVGHDAGQGRTIVGGGSIQIAHSQFHSDKDLFCRPIEERTGKKVFVGLIDAF